jgi:aspartate/methionine/tyrosine aminotransferase
MFKPAKRLGEVEEYYFSKKLREIKELNDSGKKIINLGIGSPDLPPAQEVVDELNRQSVFTQHHAYQSYSGIPELRQAFADWYQQYYNVHLNPDKEILPLIGSKEGIMHISMTYLDADHEVLVPNPGYPAYRAVAHLTGANIVNYDLKESHQWLPNLEVLADQDLSKVKLMWVNYPNMPTGANGSKHFFEQLIRFAYEHYILICNDNPYSFVLNDSRFSLLEIDGAKEVAIELNSLSKSHNMAGWRVGMMASNASYISDVLRFKSNMDSGMFKPVQLAATKALQLPQSWYDELNMIYKKRRQKIFLMMDVLQCQYDPEQVGMFVWAKVPPHYESGYQLADEILYQANVFITPGGIFGTNGERYIRASLCNPEEVLNEAIDRVVKVMSVV